MMTSNHIPTKAMQNTKVWTLSYFKQKSDFLTIHLDL